MRQTMAGRGEAGAQAGSLAHGNGVAGDSIAGVSGEAAVNATAGHEQTVAVARDQRTQWDVINLNTDPAMIEAFTFARIGRVDIDAECTAADRVAMPNTIDEILVIDRCTAMQTATFAHTDLAAGSGQTHTDAGAALAAQDADFALAIGRFTMKSTSGIPFRRRALASVRKFRMHP